MNLFHEAKKVLDKDGKVNALGPYGKSKLTGREVSQYFRNNKVSDPQVKKAVEVALDLGGAYDVARKEIEKFYGSKILKSKEVQQALKFANEEVNEKLDLVLTVRGDKNVALALKAMKKFRGISIKRQGKVKGGEVVTFSGDEKQLQKMQSSLTGNISGLNMVSTHEEVVSENFDKDPDIKKISMATNLFAKDELVKLKDFIAKNKLDKKKIVKDLDKKKNQLQHIRDVILNPSKKSGLAPKIIQNYKEEFVIEENLVEKNLMPDIQKIVDTKGAAKVGGIMVDMFTASMINQIYNKVNDQNKKRMEKSNISTLVDIAQRMMQKNSVHEGTMAIGIFDSNPSEKRKAIAGMQKLLKGKQNVKVGSPEGQKIGDQLDMKYLSDDELADDFARSSNKNMTISQLLKKHEKRLGLNFKEEVEEAVSPAQQAAIAIAKKEKEKKESVMDSYRKMHEAKEFKQSDIDTVAKLTDRNEHTKSLMHIAKVMGERKHLKKLELIYKMHNEYGHMPMNLKSLRDEIYDDLKKEMKKYSNGDDMYGAT